MTIRDLVEKYNISATADRTDSNPNMTDMPAGSSHWFVTLRRPGRSLTVPFSMGPALRRIPTAEDVLECLLSDRYAMQESFEDWCANYGFDTDSRKAERTYKTCVTQSHKLNRFLPDDWPDDIDY